MLPGVLATPPRALLTAPRLALSTALPESGSLCLRVTLSRRLPAILTCDWLGHNPTEQAKALDIFRHATLLLLEISAIFRWLELDDLNGREVPRHRLHAELPSLGLACLLRFALKNGTINICALGLAPLRHLMLEKAAHPASCARRKLTC